MGKKNASYRLRPPRRDQETALSRVVFGEVALR
jgi:hypothetical protein